VTRTKIKALWEQGMTWRAIAKTVGCGPATVARWVLKFKEAKDARISDNIAVLDEPRPGAPTKLTKAIGKAIIKFTEGKCNRHLSAIRVHIQRRFGVVLTRGRIDFRTISHSTGIEAVSSAEATSPPSPTKEEARQICSKTFES
jgi:transposase